MKKLISLLLSIATIFSFTACSEENKTGDAQANSEASVVFKNKDSVELGTPSKTLDAQEIYAGISYTPEMLYGDYQYFGDNEVRQKYAEGAEFMECFIGGNELTLTKLPVAIEAGKHNLRHKISYAEDYDWALVSFMRKTSTGEIVLYDCFCAYEFDGTKLIFKPLDEFDFDEENNKITYSFSDVVLRYDFSFRGRKLTLSDGTNSIELDGALDPYAKHDYFYVDAYLSNDSEQIDDIYNFEFFYDAEEKKYTRVYATTDKGESSRTAILELCENGLFTITVPLKESTNTYQFVYFYCHLDGLILTDGNNTYYYNYDYTDYHKGTINKYISEETESSLDKLDENEIKEIIEKKDNLLTELSEAFEKEGIKVTIDEENGGLAVDSSILFGGDSAVLSNEGKDFLKKFVNIYTSIVFSDKYKGFISKTLVEGHTAPISGSTYESGLQLSVERANNVKDYCISDEIGIDVTEFESALEAVGLSNSKPIKDNDGNVDLAASRRVSFRFIINIE